MDRNGAFVTLGWRQQGVHSCGGYILELWVAVLRCCGSGERRIGWVMQGSAFGAVVMGWIGWLCGLHEKGKDADNSVTMHFWLLHVVDMGVIYKL